MTHPLKAAALRYAAKGWPVFLLGHNKRPVANCDACRDADASHDREACRCLTCHGLYAATRESRRIDIMFRLVPRPMLAIRTGLASRLVVVDVDPDHGGEDTLTGLVSDDLCPPTLLVRTGSGGRHLYYRHPGGKAPCSQGRLGPGIDIRGDGGYVVAPPSIHPRTHTAYEWIRAWPVAEMPSALVKACQPRPAPAPTPHSSAELGHGEGITSPQRLLESLLATIARAPEGKRRTTLYGAARGVARMVAVGAINRSDAWAVLTEAGRNAQQTERETRTAIQGGFHAEGVTL
ncbi:DNA primase [Rhizocola hellebori]|uniref:DNA primase n=1 Tax=Rhizocola hellebori TaxID=1392758 RepID=A0A8J3QLT0_9ACTN|nr:bifunctional DNA primase/polymerase [Rhizocola hellebori]GIH11798.1 DNA primase [Rhizocola hellebori]